MANIHALLDDLNPINDRIDGLGTGFQGSITTADTPTEKGIYIPTEAGVYPNAGGLEYAPEGEDEGFLVQFIYNGSEWVKNSYPLPIEPIGVVEEGNTDAVSGDTVFKIAETLNIDRINPIYGDFHTRQSARNSVPSGFRHRFVTIKYRQPFGEVIETFVGSSTYNALAGNWERLQDQNFIGHTNLIIDRLTGNLMPWPSSVFTSKYVSLADLTIENYYALSGTKDVCFVYDINLSYLGTYTDDTVISGQNEKYSLTRDAVRLIYPSAVLIRLLGQTNKGLIVYNTTSNIIPGLYDEQLKFDKINYDYLYELGYYTSKIDGRRIANAGLKTSDPMRIVDRDNLIINGYSNPSADRPLIVWFDKELNFIGSYTTETTEYVYNRLITTELIPDNAVFAIINCTDTQVTRNDGLDTNFGRQQSQDISVYSIKDRLAHYLRRSDNPNPVNGGRIKLVNYLGNVQNIHPKVLYFSNGWNGYKYWMAYTPYPYSITTAENPSIAVSHDGEKWFTPEGLTNPIEPGFEGGYNSDTHLVYRSDTDTLECWYRPYDIALSADQIVRKVSSDGINWGATEVIFDYSDPGMLSPSIIFEEGKYKIWYPTGSDMRYMESVGDSISNWSERTILPIDRGDITFWHSDVIRTDLGLEFVIHCKGAGNDNIYYIIQYEDGSFSELKKIIERGDDVNDDTYSSLYRASILKIDGIYSIYYSGISTGYFRSLFLTKGRDIEKLRGVNL